MSNFQYIHYTNIITFLSLAIIIAIVSFCIIKHKFKVFHGAIILICLFVMYLFVPLRFCVFHYAFKHPEYIETILKFSINPYEKRICYKYLAQIYRNNIYNERCKNIDRPIYYMEKAIDGHYLEHKEETIILAHWYSLKGDWDRTIELNNIIKNAHGASLRNAYIMNNEYQKAVDSYIPKKNLEEEFLRADLYKNIKKYKEANISLNKAQKAYNKNLKNIVNECERIRYIENVKKFKTVENYKKWLVKKCLEFHSNI